MIARRGALAALGALLLAGAACPGGQKNSESRNPPGTAGGEGSMSIYERVQKQIGDGEVQALPGVTVAGFDLLWVAQDGPADETVGHALAVPAGTDTLLRGAAAMKALAPAAGDDAAVLARLALAFLQGGGEPITDVAATSEAKRAAGVGAPSLAGASLTYWYLTYGINSHELHRATVDTGTWAVDSQIVPLGAAASGTVARAEKSLAADNPGSNRLAIDMLLEDCSPAGATLLEKTAQNHPRAEIRAAATDALGRCHGPDSVAALGALLADTGTPTDIRWRAAQALGAIGDPTARLVLEKAAGDASAEVARAASRALDALGK